MLCIIGVAEDIYVKLYGRILNITIDAQRFFDKNQKNERDTHQKSENRSDWKIDDFNFDKLGIVKLSYSSLLSLQIRVLY